MQSTLSTTFICWLLKLHQLRCCYFEWQTPWYFIQNFFCELIHKNSENKRLIMLPWCNPLLIGNLLRSPCHCTHPCCVIHVFNNSCICHLDWTSTFSKQFPRHLSGYLRCSIICLHSRDIVVSRKNHIRWPIKASLFWAFPFPLMYDLTNWLSGSFFSGLECSLISSLLAWR